MALTWKELSSLPKDQLIELHDEELSQYAEGMHTYRQEIARRFQDEQTARMLQCTENMLAYTKSIKAMTFAMTLLAGVNVIVAVILLVK